ncbi:MAG: hypothetical protein EOO05_15165 [Chitinophagaceae bacterium]|nr:MAG: hypothetical protein EOO05_15165 [Chitinophagaceae bacterium]
MLNFHRRLVPALSPLRLVPALSLLLLLTACKKSTSNDPPPPDPASTASFTSFSFRSANNPSVIGTDIAGVISDHEVNVVIPFLADVDSLIPSFTSDASKVMLNDVRQKSDSSLADFRHRLTYTLIAEDGTAIEYKVSVKKYTALPIIRINTKNSAPITSTETYIEGTFNVTANGTDLPDYSGKTEVRGRGNSTWGMPKKPYRIKLDKKSEILGMPTNKNWVLLANYSDKSLMRNMIAFRLGEWFGLSYTPRGQFVEVFLNNEYQGCYFLTEQIKPDPNRVNITEMDVTDETPSTITGGYMLEVDQRLDAEHWWFTTQGVALTIKEPEAITTPQLNYITGYIQQMEDALYSTDFKDPANGYLKYINDDTFIQWYWVNELFRNQDADFFSSIFLYKDRDQKLSMGPVWDFDLGAGNIDYNNSWEPTGWYIRKSVWISRLFQDPAFRTKSKAKWIATKTKIAGLMTLIDETAKTLQYSQVENFKKWDILNIYVWPNRVVTGSYANEVAYLKTWLQTRIAWIDAELALEN